MPRKLRGWYAWRRCVYVQCICCRWDVWLQDSAWASRILYKQQKRAKKRRPRKTTTKRHVALRTIRASGYPGLRAWEWSEIMPDSLKQRSKEKLRWFNALWWPCTSLSKGENEEKKAEEISPQICISASLCVQTQTSSSFSLSLSYISRNKRKREEADYIFIYQFCFLSMLYNINAPTSTLLPTTVGTSHCLNCLHHATRTPVL